MHFDTVELIVQLSKAGWQGTEKERSIGKWSYSIPGSHPLSFKINEAINMAQSIIFGISKVTEEEIL